MVEMSAEVAKRHVRPPRWLTSLRMRLALAIAFSVAVTGIGASWLALQLGRQAMAEEVARIAVLAAERAADELQRLPSPLAADALTVTLREIDASAPEIETISFIVESAGATTTVAYTGSAPTGISIALAEQAMRQDRVVTLENEDMIRVAAPVVRQAEPRGAVVARANLGAVIALQQRAVRAIAGFALLAIVVLVVIVDLLAWPLVHRPVEQLRDTIARVTAGDFSARAPVWSDDEIGEVGAGLNAMLRRLEDLNDSLQSRVYEATSELEQRSEQLVESYQRLFALREQLASAEQLASVGQTAANVAHQVGTPLNLISGYVQLLKEELGPGSPHAPRLAIIEEQIARVTSTVRTLLDRSRQMGRKTRTAAGALVVRVCDLMRLNLETARIALDIDTPAGDTPILVDAINLELALLNLMTNAVDAMPEGGTLTVRVVHGAAGRVRIAIADTGHGVPDDLLPRIFDAWVSTKKPGRGTGLGLAIARDVVSAHGGSISVSSSVGRGTTFTIDLPSDAGRETARTA
jgi:two-component system, NtrC family, sensor kinase